MSVPHGCGACSEELLQGVQDATVSLFPFPELSETSRLSDIPCTDFPLLPNLVLWLCTQL